MPQFVSIAAIGAGLIAAAGWARRRWAQLDAERQKADMVRRGDEARTVGSLKDDPKTGVYRPN